MHWNVNNIVHSYLNGDYIGIVEVFPNSVDHNNLYKIMWRFLYKNNVLSTGYAEYVEEAKEKVRLAILGHMTDRYESMVRELE